jgi:hypothetical protein
MEGKADPPNPSRTAGDRLKAYSNTSVPKFV